MLYARIAGKTIADEYFAVTSDHEREMRKLRAEMHRRMLGNGNCARPVEMDCHFESICESCSFFVTTIEFRHPATLTRRRRPQGPDRAPEGLRPAQPARHRRILTRA
jgi:hypothetical protein